MNLPDLYKFAYDKNIPVFSSDCPSSVAISIKDSDGDCAIGMDYSVIENERDELSVLAHELGHCETGAFYNRYSDCDVVSRHEYRANKWAIKKLLPQAEMEEALKSGYVEVWQLAEYFDVSEELIKKALWIYFDKAA